MKRLFLSIVFVFLGLIFLVYPSSSFATWTKYPNNPVLSFGASGNFDFVHVGAPFIIFSNSIFHLWYNGHDGSKWRIGYAESADGINWINRTKINLNDLTDPYSYHINEADVIYENGMYKMWYTAADQIQFNMHINYTTSVDGINWANPTVNVLTPSLPWESGRGISSVSVIHDNQGYKMWYSGESNGIWQIGLATSFDGVIWTKHGNPIMSAINQTWEGSSVGNPTVILNNGLYEMYYHADTGIGNAISLDGIVWNRHPDNPLLYPSQNFDNYFVGDPFVLKLNNQDRMWYSGINTNFRYQIGLATNDDIVPTLTPSPTPTSTPSGPFPVVLIPGMGASWNQMDMFSCNLSQSNTWTMAPYAKSVYNRIINTFTKNVGLKQNKDFYIYGYDWRLPMTASGEKLKTFLDSIPVSKVNIVSHSLGGLVARSYILENPASHKVNKLITLGTPHQGTPNAYPLWEDGKVEIDNLVFKMAINTLLNICRIPTSFPLKTKRQVIHEVAPSVRDILPTFDFIYMNNQLVTADLIEGENPWLLANPFNSPFDNASVMTISGIDKKTTIGINVKTPSSKDVGLGNWIDGEPISDRFTNSGDGTVLMSSSLLSGSTTKTFSTDHIGVVNDKGPIQETLNFLGYGSFHPAIAAPLLAQSALSITVNKPANLELLNSQNGSLQKSDSGIVADFSDKARTYKLKLIPDINGDIILSISQNGTTDTWKDYTLNVKKGQLKNFFIIYNPQKPAQNPLIAY